MHGYNTVLCMLTFQRLLTEERFSVAFQMAYLRPIRVIVCPASLVSKFLLSVSHSQAWAKNFLFSGNQDKSRTEGTWEITKEYFGDQKIHQCMHGGGKCGGSKYSAFLTPSAQFLPL